MSNVVLILGESGSGKTTSLRNLDPEKCLLIQPIEKRLPFLSTGWKKIYQDENGESKGSIFTTNNYLNIATAIKIAPSMGKEIIIIDDFQYFMVGEFMDNVRKGPAKGNEAYERYNELAVHVYDSIMEAIKCTDNIRIYFLSHLETDNFGNQKIKTIGKMLDDKVKLEGLFTIVIKCCIVNGYHCFSVKNSGMDTTKAPMGMFQGDCIDNDLKLVDETYKKYYGIN
jgi:hypothetical protein